VAQRQTRLIRLALLNQEHSPGDYSEQTRDETHSTI